MDAYNYKLFTGDIKNAFGHMKGHWWSNMDKAAECIKCGACEKRCTQQLPIIARLKEIKENL